MNYLVLVRHGQSQWNIANRFTGWVDVGLTEKGIHEALIAAEELQGITIDVAFTSDLMRAHLTLGLILSKQQKVGIYMHDEKEHNMHALHPGLIEEDEMPIYQDDALNERWYGELQGKNKQQMREEFGEEQVHIWRRSWDVRPPGGESLKDTTERTMPYFFSHILPQLEQGKNVLVSAHGNSLRAIMKHLEHISDEDIPNLELPTGKPIFYSFENGSFTRESDVRFDRPVSWEPLQQ